MNSDTIKPNVQVLQKSVIELLRTINALMKRAAQELATEDHGTKYEVFQQEIMNESRKVAQLELTMAIVAPMKAGKSTIINAILGQELLPSRNAAMTSLPTEIVFNHTIAEPILKLSPAVLEVFELTFEVLKAKIGSASLGRVWETKSQYPHLMDLLKRIQASEDLPIKSETSGREAVLKTLTDLNDMVRLCNLFAPLSDPLQFLMDLPRLETPLVRSQTGKSMLGNLVLVDTPGPNEARADLELANVVSKQLNKSSMVLIVLDFTQLKTEAAEKVKQDVEKVINLRGKDNLYVLINKIDQRRKGDMNEEGVRDFVASELGLDSKDRVFEISARWALSASNFIQEIQDDPNCSVKEMKTGRSLAQEVFVTLDDDELEVALESVTTEKLYNHAQRLWKKSKFAPFLESAIDVLIAQVVPHCIRSALNMSRNCLIELRDDVTLRRSAIAQDAKKLKAEIQAIEADLVRLEACHHRSQKAITKIKQQLSQALETNLKVLKDMAQVSLETYFVQEEYQRSDLIKRADIKARKMLLKPLSEFDLFPNWISLRLKSQLEFKSAGVVVFASANIAEEFAELALTYAKRSVDILMQSTREESCKQIEQARQNAIDVLKWETEPIIVGARDRLNKSFNVNLELPTLILDSGTNVDFVQPRVKSHTKKVTEYKKIKNRPFWLLWLLEIERTVKINKEENYYTVSMQELINQFNQSIEKNIEHINQRLNEYLDADFQQKLEICFADLSAYLNNYQDSLKQAQKDQNLSLFKQNELIQGLDPFVQNSTRLIDKTEKILKQINKLKMLE